MSSPRGVARRRAGAAGDEGAAPQPAGARGLRREFDDHMSSEGRTSSIPLIIRIMYVVLLGYSYLCHLITGEHFLTQFCFYFVIIIMFYIWHWLAHQPFMGRMHEIHWRHHFHSFPPKKFYGEPGTCTREYGSECPTFLQLMDPRTSTNFTIHHEGILYGLLAIALLIERFVLHLHWLTVALSLLMAAVIGSVGSALHSSFHVRGFQFEKYAWYMELRALHYIHHLGSTQHNFGVFNIGLVDGVMNSIRLTDPVTNSAQKVALPERISPAHVLAAHSTAGSAGRLLLLTDVHHEEERAQLERLSAVQRGYPTVLTRFVLVGCLVWFWYTGQQLVRAYTAPLRIVSDVALADAGHALFAPLRRIVLDARLEGWLHNAQLAATDAAVVLLIVAAVFGRTVRGSLALLCASLCRIGAQVLTPFVAVPATLVLPPRTLPTLFGNVPAHEASFFAPHFAVAVVALLNAAAAAPQWRRVLLPVAALAAAFQLAAALTLHTSWSIDVLVALALALLSFRVASACAPLLDGMKTLS